MLHVPLCVYQKIRRSAFRKALNWHDRATIHADRTSPGSYGSVIQVPTYVELEEEAAPSLQLDPFDELAGAELCGVQPERITAGLEPSLFPLSIFRISNLFVSS